MDLEQSWWSYSGRSRSRRLWEDLTGPLWVLNDWVKYKVASKVLGWRGTMLVVLENVLVVSSGLKDFDWSRVALERWQCWSGMMR